MGNVSDLVIHLFLEVMGNVSDLVMVKFTLFNYLKNNK